MVSGALILNATYEPLSVVSSRRAVVLVIRGKAVVLERQDEEWASESSSFAVPSVIKLTQFVKVPYQRTVPVTRRAVFGRDGHMCQYCRGPAESIDHVIPKSRGGQNTWDNVVAACRRCNVRKGSRLPSEANLTLLKRPEPPQRYGWIYASAGYRFDPVWNRYLLAG
ncbi:MAG: HNH endonuclease [Acidimicrobiia bacterium]|jgi:5-methylcytosine-specific restriction endonuclease McrA|nr:HNH endonuclease [Acidimicrobiia bacterium]